jgi:hypothetical protein
MKEENHNRRAQAFEAEERRERLIKEFNIMNEDQKK